jgi:hypothetical protein
MSESTYEPGDDGGDPNEITDLDQAFGDDDVDATVLDTGYSPPERPLGMNKFGTTAAEELAGESLDQRLAQEEPDPALAEDINGSDGSDGSNESDESDESDDNLDDLDETRFERQELVYSEVGNVRAGRLVDPDEGLGPDLEKDLVGDDVGIDAGAASAEEAAVHVIPD